MTMHLDNRFSTINTRKQTVKITKAKQQEFVERWRAHNKSCKRSNQHSLMYDTVDDYIDYCFGKIKLADPRDYRNFTTYRPKVDTWRQSKEYPSQMEESIKNGTFHKMGHNTSKKEPQKYTGTLIKGIATMHKSNAIPVMDDQHIIDIAHMRR